MAKTNSKIARAIANERDGLIDSAEKTVAEKVKEGNLQAAMFVLTTIGKTRGWLFPKDAHVAIGDSNSVTIQNVVITSVPSGTFVPLPTSRRSKARSATTWSTSSRKSLENRRLTPPFGPS